MPVHSPSESHASPFNPARQLITAVLQNRLLWLVPLILGTVASAAYAYLWPKSYAARQTLVIRDDLIGQSFKPGRFESMESLKSAQEMVLEIARRPKVIRKTLLELGPPTPETAEDWPTESTIEDIQGAININAPNGGEFGKSEAIVLSVTAGSRERARQFIDLLLDEVEAELRLFRASRIESMATELKQAEAIARDAYEKAAQELGQFEEKIGADLPDLRELSDAQAGGQGLRASLVEVTREYREALRKVESTRQQREMLQTAYGDPDYLATSNELLEMQPDLAYLRKGLKEAQLRLSQNMGPYSNEHPKVQADRATINDLKARIRQNTLTALQGIEVQLEDRASHCRHLESLLKDYTDRLTKLSSLRVPYQKLVQVNETQYKFYGDARANLAEIEAVGSAALNINLLTRVDEPQVGTNPVGPSKKMILIAGATGGLLFGIGMVMFFAPIDITEQPLHSERTELQADSTSNDWSQMAQEVAQLERAQDPDPDPSGYTGDPGVEPEHIAPDEGAAIFTVTAGLPEYSNATTNDAVESSQPISLTDIFDDPFDLSSVFAIDKDNCNVDSEIIKAPASFVRNKQLDTTDQTVAIEPFDSSGLTYVDPTKTNLNLDPAFQYAMDSVAESTSFDSPLTFHIDPPSAEPDLDQDNGVNSNFTPDKLSADTALSSQTSIPNQEGPDTSTEKGTPVWQYQPPSRQTAKPIQLDKLKEELQRLHEPNTVEPEQQPATPTRHDSEIDEQIARLSESIAKFCNKPINPGSSPNIDPPNSEDFV